MKQKVSTRYLGTNTYNRSLQLCIALAALALHSAQLAFPKQHWKAVSERYVLNGVK